MSGLVVLLIVVALAVLVVVLYNGLVRLRNDVRNAWSQIDVQLKRRHDLIPNLIESVRGYLQHEREVLQRVTEARTRAVAASGAASAGAAEAELSQALGRLAVVMEAYPELKANQNVLALQEELTTTENRIGFARQLHNDLVAQYNTKQEVFPGNLVAGLFQFTRAEYYQAEAGERAVPKVDLGPR